MTRNIRLDAEALLQHSSWISVLARRLVRGEAEDLVQDTWLAALNRPPTSGVPLRPWLERVVRNLASKRLRGDRHRSDREFRAGGEGRELPPLPTPDELVARSEEQRAVEIDRPVRLGHIESAPIAESPRPQR